MNKVFLSWSGEPSRTVALALKRWLPNVIHVLEPWVSNEDIRPGDRWSSEVSQALATTEFGIVCVTELSQASPWLNFEAGALAKTLDRGRVFPYLTGLQPSELKGPLAQFQGVSADEAGTLGLLRSLNRFINPPLDNERLTSSFQKWWPDLAAVLKRLPEPSREVETSGAEWPFVKTVQSLERSISRLSSVQRKILREVVKEDSRVSSEIFREFFRAKNRIGGGGGIYPHTLVKLLGCGRAELIYRCKDLERGELIHILNLTDKCYQLTDSVLRLVNTNPTDILSALYSPEERNNPPIEPHRGSVTYKDGRPDFFTDAEQKPLDGVFSISWAGEPGVYLFKDGRIEGPANVPVEAAGGPRERWRDEE